MCIDYLVFGALLGFITTLPIAIALHFIWRVLNASESEK